MTISTLCLISGLVLTLAFLIWMGWPSRQRVAPLTAPEQDSLCAALGRYAAHVAVASDQGVSLEKLFADLDRIIPPTAPDNLRYTVYSTLILIHSAPWFPPEEARCLIESTCLEHLISP